MIVAVLALMEGVTVAGFEGVDLDLVWTRVGAVIAAGVHFLSLRVWLGVLYRNVHAFAGEPMEDTRIHLGIMRIVAPFAEIGSMSSFFAMKLGRAPPQRALLLAPLGLFVFILFDRLAARVGSIVGSTTAIGLAIMGHTLLLLSAGAAVWLTLRLGAAHREVAFRWPGPGAAAGDW